ncbi:MAG: imidazole glycerol phosphate synthase subunit HisH [Desulfobacterota bacterium]|nr:imidazole glycerol phosphate synthase subunit HisH [Thermodesulfobacteriota bacterium]MDW8001709.1 imidazole glycerol phosphate synthase subunit HisH [Deltaproteobacteria bacterium]
MITILDYGAGNVRSVTNAILKLGFQVKFVKTPKDILSAETIVFPGVGAFGEILESLRKKDLIEPLIEYLKSGRPYLGICLGMQLLFEESEEAPGKRGIGFFKGKVRRLRTHLSVPHIGWNGIKAQKPSFIFDGLKGEEKFYFVHSYVVEPLDEEIVLTRTDYGEEFVSSVQKGLIVGTQFHPEKSGKAGLRMLSNFLNRKSPFMPSLCPEKTTLSKRIVVCLDVRSDDDGRLVVTKGDRYDVRDKETKKVRNLGNPVKMAQEYFDEGADEIVFLNITGFRNYPLFDQPMLDLLKETSKNVFIPLTIGGGIKGYKDDHGNYYSALDVASAYFRSGADKVSIGSDAVVIAQDFLKNGPSGKSSIEEISKVYGSQAVVVSIDPKRVYVTSPNVTKNVTIETEIPGPNGERYCYFMCTTKGGREGSNIDAITLAKIVEQLGCGEILLNSIDRDGTKMGFDIELIQAVSQSVSIPVIASSGAGKSEHFLEVFLKTNCQAALAAGIFHRREISIRALKEFLNQYLPIRVD